MTLNMHQNEWYEIYLGLAAFTDRNKQRLFDGIREKSMAKVAGMEEQNVLYWRKRGFD